MNVLSVTLVSGIFLVSISALSQFCLPHLRKGRMYAQENSSLPSSEIQFAVNESLNAFKGIHMLKTLCLCITHHLILYLCGSVYTGVWLHTWFFFSEVWHCLCL